MPAAPPTITQGNAATSTFGQQYAPQAAQQQAAPAPTPTPQPSPNQNAPTRDNNPGSLMDGQGHLRVFSSYGEGYAALLNDLNDKMSGKTNSGLSANSTLMDFANVYAPKAAGNSPGHYAAELANQLKVPPTTTIGSLKPRITDFANAIGVNEGSQPPSGQDGQQSIATLNPHPAGNGYVTPPPAAAAGTIPAAPPSPPQQGQGIAKALAGGVLPQALLGAAKSVPNAGQGLANLFETGLNQTAGRFADLLSGKGFSAPSGNVSGQLPQLPSSVTEASNPAQELGELGGDVTQMAVGDEAGVGAAGNAIGGGISDLLDLGSTGTKAANIASTGLLRAGLNTTLAKAQGGSTGASIGTGVASAVIPPVVEGLVGPIADLIGGKGTADAFSAKAANPEAYAAWKNGTQTAGKMAESIANDFETKLVQPGIADLNAAKDAMPDVASGETKQSIIDGVKARIAATKGTVVTPSDRIVFNALLDHLEQAVPENPTARDLLDLRTGMGKYFGDVPNGEYTQSNAVVKDIDSALRQTALKPLEDLPAHAGALAADGVTAAKNAAEEMDGALKRASDNIKFQEDFKDNILGGNSKKVQAPINIVNGLKNAMSDPAKYEGLKNLLTEFEQKIGNPGKYTSDLGAGQAVKILKGFGTKAAVKVGLPILGTGLVGAGKLKQLAGDLGL